MCLPHCICPKVARSRRARRSLFGRYRGKNGHTATKVSHRWHNTFTEQNGAAEQRAVGLFFGRSEDVRARRDIALVRSDKRDYRHSRRRIVMAFHKRLERAALQTGPTSMSRRRGRSSEQPRRARRPVSA